MIDEPRSAPVEAREATRRKASLVLAGIALLVIAITQVVLYTGEGEVNGGLILLAALIVTSAAWRHRRGQ